MKVYANGLSGTIGKHISKKVSGLEGDLRKSDQFSKFEEICGEDLVFIHLAAVVGASLVERDISSSHQINVDAVERMGEISLGQNIKKFIYVSTSHVYARSNEKISESYPLNPQSVYANQKMKAEDILLEIFSEQPERLLILRVFSILDWGMPKYTLGGAIEKLLTEPETSTLSNSDDIRDFLTPRNVANNLENIAINSNLSGVYNLCSGKGQTLKEAALCMAKYKNINLSDNCFKINEKEVTKIVGDNDKLLSAYSNLNLKWDY